MTLSTGHLHEFGELNLIGNQCVFLCFTSFLVGKVKLVPNILRHNLVPCRKRVDFLCGIGRSSYRMFIAEAHTVTGEDTHGSGGLQVCGPARSLQTGTGSC